MGNDHTLHITLSPALKRTHEGSSPFFHSPSLAVIHPQTHSQVSQYGVDWLELRHG